MKRLFPKIRSVFLLGMAVLSCQIFLAEEEIAEAINMDEDFLPPEISKIIHDSINEGPESVEKNAHTILSASHDEGWLVLDNGDSLPASFQGKKTGSSQLEIKSSLMEQPFSFDINQIDTLYLMPRKKEFPGNAQILMTNGDIIKGTLKGIDDKTVSVETNWGGTLLLKRAMISGISFQERDNLLYSQMDKTAPLKNIGEREAWANRENQIMSNNAGAIGTTTPLSSKVRLSFVFSCDRYTQLGVGLWANSLETDFPPFVYLFRISPNSVQLQRRLNGGTITRAANALVFPAFDKILLPTRIDIFADRDTETFYLYVNGIQQATWNKGEPKTEVVDKTEPQPDVTEKKEAGQQEEKNESGEQEETFGNGFYFTNHISGSFVSISNTTITKWNGIFPGAELLDVPGTLRNKAIQTHEKSAATATVIQPRRFEAQKPIAGYSLIHLKNGDFFRTQITELSTNGLTAKSGEQSLNIPLERVWGLEFTNEKEIKQRLSKDDIKIRFSDNSQITLRLRQGADNVLQTFSESMGDVNIQLPYVKNIMFNLYNESLKNKRTLMDTISDPASFLK